MFVSLLRARSDSSSWSGSTPEKRNDGTGLVTGNALTVGVSACSPNEPSLRRTRRDLRAVRLRETWASVAGRMPSLDRHGDHDGGQASEKERHAVGDPLSPVERRSSHAEER